MKEFKISENEIQKLAAILMEFPAKNVLTSIDILRNLPIIEEIKPD